MVHRIDRDLSRYRRIVRGRIKENLRKYITRGDLIARQGDKTVSIPLPQIRVPRFRYGKAGEGGVGQGEGEPGTPLDESADEAGIGPGAGDTPGEHALEVDVPLEELAELLGEELELPRIEPKGSDDLKVDRSKFTGIRTVGPESLRHFRRTFKEALKREIASGTYDPGDPVVVPIRADTRYRAFKTVQKPESNAVIIYMMDVSGSMGDEQKEIVRIESFWIDTWLRSQYQNLQVRYIVHDAQAREVDQHTFYHIRESGGTKISSAYRLAQELLQVEYPAEDWNTYLFHFSDGDNWGHDDTRQCIELLREHLLPRANIFCYGQVKSAYGSGQFKKDLDSVFEDDEVVVTSDIGDRDDIYDSIKTFLGKGR